MFASTASAVHLDITLTGLYIAGACTKYPGTLPKVPFFQREGRLCSRVLKGAGRVLSK